MKKLPHAKNMAQQGDVQLLRVDALPEGCKQRKGLTIDLGKATGHHHTFEDDGMTCVMDAPNGEVYVVKKASPEETKPLVHQEHGPFTIAPGVWRFEPVIEKDWFNDMVRKVVD